MNRNSIRELEISKGRNDRVLTQVLGQESEDAVYVRFEGIERGMVGPLYQQRLSLRSALDEIIEVTGSHRRVGSTMHEHDRRLDESDPLPRRYVIEPESDRPLHCPEEAALDRGRKVNERRSFRHCLPGVGESRYRDNRVDLVGSGSGEDRSPCANRVADHPDRRNVLAGAQPMDCYIEVLGKTRHRDEVIVFAPAVVSGIEEQSMETRSV